VKRIGAAPLICSAATALLVSAGCGPKPLATIVDIDDLSLSTIGQWPWRRDRIAQLIARLREQGAV
jgi:CHASE2 domain-containing sensor protein